MAAPSVLARQSNASSTSDASTFTPTLPTVTTGEALLSFVSADGAPVLSTTSTGWQKLLQASNTTVVTGAVFFKRVATGSDALVVASDSAQQFSAVTLCISVDDNFDAAIASANGSSTNSNPPNLALYASLDALWVASRHGDSTVVATVAPSGYSNLQSRAAGGTSGASTDTAEKTSTASSEDPGTFTSATEQWASFTVGLWNDTRSRLSASDRAASLTLSNSNLTATSGSILDPGGFGDALRATRGRTTGKYGFSFRRTSAGGNYFGVGLSNANSSRFVSQNAGANELHLYWDPGGAVHNLWAADAVVSTADFDQNEWNVLLVDLDADLAWLYDPESGNYNGNASANPDTGTLGIDISGVALNGGLHPTLNFGASSVAGEYDGSTLNSAPNATSFSAWDASPSGSPYNMTAASGAYTFSGTAAGLRETKTMPAASGSYSLTGATAALRLGKTLAAASGSYNLTGTAAVLPRVRRLVAATAAYTLSGTAAALKSGRRLVAASATYAVTGTVAALRWGRKLTAASGGYTLSGTAATLTATTTARVLSAAAGTYALTGTVAALKQARRLVAGSGSYAMSGTAAALRRGKTMAAAAGSYALTGTAAAFRRAYNMAAGTAAYLLSGAEVVFDWGGRPVWSPVSANPETWTDEPSTSEAWTPASTTSETWSAEADTPTAWTPRPTTPETWH